MSVPLSSGPAREARGCGEDPVIGYKLYRTGLGAARTLCAACEPP